MKLLVTGGAGFIGSAVIRHVIGTTDWESSTSMRLPMQEISPAWKRWRRTRQIASSISISGSVGGLRPYLNAASRMQ